MFTVFTLESLKFWKFKAKNISRIFFSIIVLLFLCLYLFPLGDVSYILQVQKWLQQNTAGSVTDLAQVLETLNLTAANWLNIASFIVSWFIFFLLLILFVYLQIAHTRKENYKEALANYLQSLPAIIGFLLLWTVVLVFSAPLFFIPFLFVFSATYLAPFILLLKKTRFWQSMSDSFIVMHGYKLFSLFVIMALYLLLNSSFNLLLTAFLKPFVYLQILSIALKEALLFLFMARACYLFYFYLVEYTPPFYRVLGVADPYKMLAKLDADEYPFFNEELKNQLTAMAFAKRNQDVYNNAKFDELYQYERKIVKEQAKDRAAAATSVEFEHNANLPLQAEAVEQVTLTTSAQYTTEAVAKSTTAEAGVVSQEQQELNRKANKQDKYERFLANREVIRQKLHAYLADSGEEILPHCENSSIEEIERRFYPPLGQKVRRELETIIAEVAEELKFKRQTRKITEE